MVWLSDQGRQHSLAGLENQAGVGQLRPHIEDRPRAPETFCGCKQDKLLQGADIALVFLATLWVLMSSWSWSPFLLIVGSQSPGFDKSHFLNAPPQAWESA